MPPRYLALASICALLLPASAWGLSARADRATSVNPTAAAHACASRTRAGGRLQKPDPGRVASLVSCVLRTERRQLGLGYSQDRVASRLTGAALGRFVATAYPGGNGSQDATRVENLAAANIRQAVCGTTRAGTSRDQWAFADAKPPEGTSPLQVAKLMATEIEAPGAVAGTAGAVFGVAAHRGLLFRFGDLKGISLGMVAIACP